jgi:transcriptional regulator with XRE-family HTH domain
MMDISEKIFARLNELHMSQSELSRKTGISTSTINDWKRKKLNPQIDKVTSICKALDLSLEDLLCDENDESLKLDYNTEEKFLIEYYRQASATNKTYLFKYLELNLDQTKRNISVIQDIDGRKIVVIHDIQFKGKRSIDWKVVRGYLQQYVGEIYTIAETDDIIYIGSDLPGEYSGSVYTNKLKGTAAKAKANASQGIPELIETATGKHFRDNKGEKHQWNARFGWYRYDSRFALPVYDDSGEIERYNVFHASLLIRHANDGRMYLYDIIDIKKETSNPLES